MGNTHVPNGIARGTIVIAHGFKGYKDYGFLPSLAHACAEAGLVAHRFNFSHSGMTNNLATFERPDLFERDTWRKQVFDLRSVHAAVTSGELPGAVLPLFVLGHSRGGVTAILATGDLTYLNRPLNGCGSEWAGVITLAAPATCNSLTPNLQRALLDAGWIESPSSRTGQRLRVGRAWLQEQVDDPSGHDVLAHAARMSCPILVIHGDADATVPQSEAQRIVQSAGERAQLKIILGGDHVFNTPNPFAYDRPASPQLRQAIDATRAFIAHAIDAQPDATPRPNVS